MHQSSLEPTFRSFNTALARLGAVTLTEMLRLDNASAAHSTAVASLISGSFVSVGEAAAGFRLDDLGTRRHLEIWYWR
jgi:hypothetical protein